MVIRFTGLYGAHPMPRTIESDLVELAVIEVAAAPGGIHRSVLWAAVAAWLAERDPRGAPPEPDRVLRALGMCIVRGEVDEVDGRVVLASAGRVSETA